MVIYVDVIRLDENGVLIYLKGEKMMRRKKK